MKHINSVKDIWINFNTNYKIGQYILLDMNKIIFNNSSCESEHLPINNMAIITEVDKFENGYPYSIEFFNGLDTDFVFVKEEEIERLLTPDEIEEFKTKKDSLKYNL